MFSGVFALAGFVSDLVDSRRARRSGAMATDLCSDACERFSALGVSEYCTTCCRRVQQWRTSRWRQCVEGTAGVVAAAVQAGATPKQLNALAVASVRAEAGLSCDVLCKPDPAFDLAREVLAAAVKLHGTLEDKCLFAAHSLRQAFRLSKEHLPEGFVSGHSVYTSPQTSCAMSRCLVSSRISSPLCDTPEAAAVLLGL
jgi:hypothetical protein